MTTKQAKQFHNTAPFEPFIIRQADGRRMLVKHSEFMATAPSGRAIIVYEPVPSTL